MYKGADKSLARPGRKKANVSVRMAWISLGALPCRKKNLMTARVSMLLKSRASLTCFVACFLPGRAKDFSAPWYCLEEVGALYPIRFLRCLWSYCKPVPSSNSCDPNSRLGGGTLLEKPLFHFLYKKLIFPTILLIAWLLICALSQCTCVNKKLRNKGETYEWNM